MERTSRPSACPSRPQSCIRDGFQNLARTLINTLRGSSFSPALKRFSLLKKGSVPSVNPASSDSKPNVGNGGGAGGGSGSSNGAGSPIDEKLLSAVASIPNLHSNLSLMMAAAVAAAAQSQSNANQLLGALPTNLKRSASSMSGGSMITTSQPTSGGGTTTTTSVSSKRNRAVPPLAAPTGALANLIQRQQQIKEQQMKEQQRKAAALAAGGLVNGQVSITPAIFGSGTSPNSSSNGGAISLVTTKKSSANSHNNNNNNNNVSNHNHNHHHGKLNSSGRGRLEQQHRDHSEYGLNMVDMDMTGGGRFPLVD
uniref:Uncharacterized protein n=1 Tax=Anopheles maculatus TaxID=74869 RepID=A0A182SPB9_9DIPT